MSRSIILANNLLNLVFRQPVPVSGNGGMGKHEIDTLKLIADIYKEAPGVKNATEMVSIAISQCIAYKRRIGTITFAGHGNMGAFHIGSQYISEEYLKPNYPIPEYREIYFSLSRLTPWFDRRAVAYIQCCYTGHGGSVVRRLSELWGIPVVAYTADVFFKDYGFERIDYENGHFVVCVSNMCMPL
jgi:hypothetical protein